MSASQSAVRSRAEAILVSRTFDWMILFTLFFVILGGYHIHYMLTGGDWDFWTDWKDRRLWVTVAPIVSITFPAAVQACLWARYRLPWGATVCVLGLLLGEWINRYLNFWGWTYFPVNFCFPSNLVPGAILLDVILMISGSFTLTAVLGGMAYGLIFYPGNWPIIAPLHMPIEYNGMMFTLADLQGYHYVRTGTPEYIRMVEKGTLRTFGKDVAPVSAFFSGFVCIVIYFLWHLFGNWFSQTRLVEDKSKTKKNKSSGNSSDTFTSSKRTSETEPAGESGQVVARSDINDELTGVTDKTTTTETTKQSVQEPKNASFYFQLEGEAVRVNQVQCGSDVDLVFDYGIPGADVLAKVVGECLEALRQENTDLGITVTSPDLTFRDDIWYQKACFREGKLENQVRFRLKAGEIPKNDAKLFIAINKAGCPLYDFVLKIQLVEPLSNNLDSEGKITQVINLDKIKVIKDKYRDMEFSIYAKDGKLIIHYTDHNTDNSDFLFSTMSPEVFTKLLNGTPKNLEPVAEHEIWSVLENPLIPVAENHRNAFIECLKNVATAGSTLFQKLKDDVAFGKMLDLIEALKNGSKVTIKTDVAFFPWEILYPYIYHKDWQDSPSPQNFWGYRFLFDCILTGSTRSHIEFLDNHRERELFVNFNLNPTIDNNSDSSYMPVAKQRDFFELCQFECDLLDSGQKIKENLETSEKVIATFIYLYCHGQNSRAFQTGNEESIEVDNNIFIEPFSLKTSVKYKNVPIIFLNSCSSGAFSVHSFSNFLTKFYEKEALGLISTSFPVPATFAAAFGQSLLQSYVEGNSIGEALFYLRRDLLHENNPVGLFYSLQCHMDATAKIKVEEKNE